MIKDNQKHFNRLHVVIDGVMLIVSYMIAWVFRYVGPFAIDAVHSVDFAWYMRLLVLIIPMYLILYYVFSLYTPKRVLGRRLELSNIIKANIVGILLLIFFIVIIMREINFSRMMLAYFFVLNILSGELVRICIRKVLRRIRKKGFNLKHVLLVGYSRAAAEYIDRIFQNPQWGYHITGILDDNVPAGTTYKKIAVLGEVSQLLGYLEQNSLDEIAITLGLGEYHKLESIVAMCEKSGVHTKFIPDYGNIIPTKPYTEDLLGLAVVNIRRVPLTNMFNAFCKRVMDIFGSIVAIILFSPIMLVACALIKLTSPGPLIYRQERVGLHNRTFMMYKFRSMEVQSKESEKSAWTVKGDPRVTSVGKFMRRTSIDELPQLFNILKGDMSLVGPRPERPFFVEKFREEVPRYMVKHQVRPGLTGWAQVNGFRGNTSIRKRIECDLYYIENWTIGLDVKILILTFFKGFINKNAY